MSSVAADTSVLVAGLLSWHEHHPPCLRALESALAEGPLIVPGAALVEAYSVMTRLPAPHRLSPRDAHELLHSNFARAARVDGLIAGEYWPMLEGLAARAIAGGATHDAHILAVARKSGAEALLTLNIRDFEALAGDAIEIRSPLEKHG